MYLGYVSGDELKLVGQVNYEVENRYKVVATAVGVALICVYAAEEWVS